ncbi:MAG: methylenetetrahydrofolate reductase [NAD(P)H] [Peptostreptococcaceae bacterium]|nr:methylenetetrahydrofolate reductase [NAD(P)H] [Peptostreptococcaceae bacterium]
MMIKDLYKEKKPVISFEIFPPKRDYPIESIYETIESLSDLNPDFISVTYGAGGSSKDRTVEIASTIKNKFNIEALAHLTCVSSTKAEIDGILKELKDNNLENILAMRGDIPEDPDFDFPDPLHFRYAKDLISRINNQNNFSIGAACYTEGHIEAISKEADLNYLKQKVDSSVDFLITQMFFDNEIFYSFMEKIDSMGINVPISAGIMPVLNINQMNRIVQLSGCSIPPKFQRILDKFEHNPEALKEAGTAYATEQIVDLLSWGIDGIHLYTMNKPNTTKEIMNNISTIRKVLTEDKVI